MKWTEVLKRIDNEPATIGIKQNSIGSILVYLDEQYEVLDIIMVPHHKMDEVHQEIVDTIKELPYNISISDITSTIQDHLNSKYDSWYGVLN